MAVYYYYFLNRRLKNTRRWNKILLLLLLLLVSLLLFIDTRLVLLISFLICCSRERRQRAMAEAACPPIHVTSDVTAAFLTQQPTSGKALMDRRQSFSHYARTDDVSDVLLGAGNDYFHHHRRRQFYQVATPCQQQDMQLVASATNHVPVDFAGTCRSDSEHIYESPNHEKQCSHPSSLAGRQLEDSYYSEHDLRVTVT